MKKSEDEPKKGAPAYMNTYGDMMTLLLCFFVLLVSMSTIDAEKFQALVASFQANVSILQGGTSLNPNNTMLQNGMNQLPVADPSQLFLQEAINNQVIEQVTEDLNQYIADKNLESSVTVEGQGDEVIIRFSDVLLFDNGKAEIKAGAIPTLSALGEKLKSYMDEGYTLNIEGHTDNVPINTSQFPSNWYLSSARAIAVASFYIDQMDFDRTKIVCIGSGEFKPIGDNSTPEGRASNRRVEVKLSMGS